MAQCRAMSARLEETIANAAAATEPAILAKYNFNLSKAMHLFHHNDYTITKLSTLAHKICKILRYTWALIYIVGLSLYKYCNFRYKYFIIRKIELQILQLRIIYV